MMTRVLVTGGSGFVGRRCIPMLVERGFTVVALARSTASAHVLRSLGAEPIIGDLDQPADLRRVFAEANADLLLNIASLGFGHTPAIIDACHAAGLQRAVFVSTTAIFTTLNAPSKCIRLAAELAVMESGLKFTIVRPTMIYGGPDDRNLARLADLLRRTPVMPLPAKGGLQQPIHVEDLAEALIACLDCDASIEQAINVAGPDPLTFSEIIRQTSAAAGRRVFLLPLPVAPMIWTARLNERLTSRPLLKAEQFQRLAEDKSVDLSEAELLLGFAPRPFSIGILDDIEGRKTQGPAATQRIGRFLRTVSHLERRQIIARVKLRLLRRLVGRFPRRFEHRWTGAIIDGPVPGWPAAFVPLDARRFVSSVTAEAISERRFELLNHEEVIGSSDWNRTDIAQLWRFHLHYWDWAWNLVANGRHKVLRERWSEWSAQCPYGRGDAWSPYVVSLRLWTLCGLHSAMSDNPTRTASLANEVRRHAGYLQSNLEVDVGGNHLIKNLKALIGAGVFLGDQRLLEQNLRALLSELDRQILADGGHYELSPSYHAQVLGDLIDVLGLLNESHAHEAIAQLRATADAMRAWLTEFVGPDGTTPSLNDGFVVPPPELELLGIDRRGQRRLVVLAETGYVVARPEASIQLILDVGWPCPPELPAHSQADCLSFVLGDSGGWSVVDTGCREYGTSGRRSFERSTAAHNTVDVDGVDQTEVWGAFRAGRRARPTLHEATDDGTRITIIGSHDGYRNLPGRVAHRRSISMTANSVDVLDELAGAGVHDVRSRLHLRSGWRLTGDRTVALRAGSTQTIRSSSPMELARATYSEEFGRELECDVVTQRHCGALPAELIWRIEL